MPDKLRKCRIFFSAAEPSADSHCASIITALKKNGCDITFAGVGGPKMSSAGCELLAETTARAAMLHNAFSQVGCYWRLLGQIKTFFSVNKPDLVIVCDSPAFNFHVAKAAKKAAIKTLFYVAPQLWAWGGWRVAKLKKYCDRLCCILPFEQDWFTKRGIDATFVGNTLLEDVGGGIADRRKKYIGFNADKAVFALLPGSRPAEIKSLWPAMQKIAMRLKSRYPAARFITAAADSGAEKLLRTTQVSNFRCEYLVGVFEAARQADFAVVASGSATLQVAAAGCPMAVMYQSSRILWHLAGRWLVKTRYLSLVNILADQMLVPEFMPYFNSIEPIVQKIEHLIEDPKYLARTSNALIETALPLMGQTKPSEKVAAIALEMLSR